MNETIYKGTLTAIGLIAEAFRSRGSVIFCLHSVVSIDDGCGSESAMSVSETFLEDIITDLRRRDVNILSLSQGIQHLINGGKPFAALTFDDGYRDLYERVFPIIRRHCVPITAFVATGFVDRKAPMWWNAIEPAINRATSFAWPGGRSELRTPSEKRRVNALLDQRFRRLDMDGQNNLLTELARRNTCLDVRRAHDAALTWDMVKEMAGSGLVEIGVHTVDHPLLAPLSAAELRHQIIGARERLRVVTGIEARYFAYPFGQPDEVGRCATEIVAEAGYMAAFTTEASLLRRQHLERRWSLPRVMLAAKAQDTRIVSAYMSGAPFWLRGLGGHRASGHGRR